jgi:proteasome activator subunit 4
MVIPLTISLPLPSFNSEVSGSYSEPKLSKKDEDALLRETTRTFADWVTGFIRRVIRLLENLPEEGQGGGDTEGRGV